MARKRKSPRAGFIPYIVNGGVVFIMFMKPSDSKYGGDSFQIAKGKVDPGEKHVDAAIREASEELGLKKSNLETIEYLGKFLGYTDIYYGRVINKDDFDPYNYETGDTKWMNIDEFLKIGRSIHIPIIREFWESVTKHEPSLQNHQCEK